MTIQVKITNEDTVATRSIHVIPITHSPNGVNTPGIATILTPGESATIALHAGLSLSLIEIDQVAPGGPTSAETHPLIVHSFRVPPAPPKTS